MARSDAWVEKKLKELAETPVPKPTEKSLARARHHGSGTLITGDGDVITATNKE